MTCTAAGPSTPCKSTLFCPDCAHEAPVDGDWVLAEGARETAYNCPNCESTITVRPSFEEPGPLARQVGAAFAPLGSWNDYLRAVQRAATSWCPSF
ncbi:hypothetical protein [Haloarchaeobius sp. DYHT-AS-18]|uniref:hypothetical protein n=1 Tax=Haloarchaeobius sp. DYHT-AS-18 TaxID=3446117 RepID=UPI003EBA4D6E